MPQFTSYRARAQASTTQERANSRPKRTARQAAQAPSVGTTLLTGRTNAPQRVGTATPGAGGLSYAAAAQAPQAGVPVPSVRSPAEFLGLDANNAMPPGTQFAQAQNPAFQQWNATQAAQTQQVVGDAQRQRALAAAGQLGRRRYMDVAQGLTDRNIAAQQSRGPMLGAGGGYVQTDPNEPATFLGSGRSAAAGADAAIAQGEAWRRMGGREDQRMVAPGARFAPAYSGRDLMAAAQAPGAAGAMMSVPDQPTSFAAAAQAPRSEATNPQVGAAAAGESAIPRQQLVGVHGQIQAFANGADGVNEDTLASRLGEMGLELGGIQYRQMDPATGEPVTTGGFTVSVRNPANGRTMSIPVPSTAQQAQWAEREGTTAQRASVRDLAAKTGIQRQEGESLEEYQGRLVEANRGLRRESLAERAQSRDAYFDRQFGRQPTSRRSYADVAQGAGDQTSPYRYAGMSIPERPTPTDVQSAKEYLKTSYPALAEFIGVGESKGRTKEDIQAWLDENGYAPGSKERRDIENALALVEKALATPAQRSGEIQEPQSPLSMAIGVRRLQRWTPEQRERARQALQR